MTLLATQTLSLPVVTTTTAETIATVDDLVYDLAKWQISGFEVITEKGKFVLPVAGIESAADNQILIKSWDSLVQHEDAPELTAELMRGPKLQEVEVRSANGERVGYLEDLEITLTDWTITGLVAGRGEVSDLLVGPVRMGSIDVDVKSPTLVQIRPEAKIDLGSETEQTVAATLQKAKEGADDLLQKGSDIINNIIK